MAELFGFRITRKKDEAESFTLPSSEDGTIDIAGGGFYSSVYDANGKDKTQYDVIKRYRNISQQPECDSAVDDVVNETICVNFDDVPVELELSNLKVSEKIKKLINLLFYILVLV